MTIVKKWQSIQLGAWQFIFHFGRVRNYGKSAVSKGSFVSSRRLAWLAPATPSLLMTSQISEKEMEPAPRSDRNNQAYDIKPFSVCTLFASSLTVLRCNCFARLLGEFRINVEFKRSCLPNLEGEQLSSRET